MRRVLLVGALCAILGLTAAACKRPVPAPASAPAPPPAAPPPPPPPPPKPVPPPPPPPAPLTDDQIFAQKTAISSRGANLAYFAVRPRRATCATMAARRPRGTPTIERWTSCGLRRGHCRHARHGL